MSKRLQVLLDEREFRDLQRMAKARQLTVSALVRETLRSARQREPLGDATAKLAAVRAAGRHAFPAAATVDDLNAEIERGYLG